MGFSDSWFRDSEDDMIRTLLDSDHSFVKGITLKQLDREHSVRLNVAPDGQRFLINTPVKQTETAPMSVILNWPAKLTK